MMTLNALVLAVSLGGVLSNGWNWAMDNPWGAALMIVGAVAVVFVIAGAAGISPGPWWAWLICGALGALLGSAGICVAGNLGGGGSTGPGPTARGAIDAIIVSFEGLESLRAEVKFRGDHKPRIETWRRSDISTKVEDIVLDMKASRPGQLTLQIKFLNVPERLQDTVVEEFRLHEVMLGVEEKRTP
jgi:hypothetical protein